MAGKRLILVAGGDGIGGVLNTAEVYNTSTRKWSPVGNMIQPRTEHAASTLSNNFVLVSGGYNGADVWNTSEVFNPASRSWTSVGRMQVARRNPYLIETSQWLSVGGRWTLIIRRLEHL